MLAGTAKENMKRMAVDGAMDWIKKRFDLQRKQQIGVGSGSTVSYFFSKISHYKNITAIPTSLNTRKELVKRGMHVEKPENSGKLTFDIDGADEVDKQLNLIKGGQGCHYMEKKVANSSDLLLIVVDQSKLVSHLGETHPLPVEVVPKYIEGAREKLKHFGEPKLRREGSVPFRTDNSNLILDLKLEKRLSEKELMEWEENINSIEGVVENGFFVKRSADRVFVGTDNGLEILGED